ncbi:MAG: glycosyl hydrolase family 28-related protein [Phycisphaerales bacterium]
MYSAPRTIGLTVIVMIGLTGCEHGRNEPAKSPQPTAFVPPMSAPAAPPAAVPDHYTDDSPYANATRFDAPFVDAVRQVVPKELGNQKLAAMGMVDVTAAPFHADPTGRYDSTAALQQAITFARDRQMVCYLPLGTYRVSDTLECVQNTYRRQNGKILNDASAPVVMLGSRAGGVKDGRPVRPTILLADNAPGYNDPEHPKYVVHFWARSPDNPGRPEPNISMNQLFIGIDITIGKGNGGAVGIRHRCAEGSGIQDCTVNAGDGLTGIEGGAGSGGMHANITVIGGKYGLDLRQTQPVPTIAGVTLIGQRDAAILYDGRQTLSAVGVKIVADHPGPMIRNVKPYFCDGMICLIDSEIIFNQPGGTALAMQRPVVLENVYVRGAKWIVTHADGNNLAGNPDGWMRVRRYAHRADPPVWNAGGKARQFRCPIHVDRKELPAGEDVCEVQKDAAPPVDLISRHVWDDTFPGWQSPGAVNVKDAPYHAVGDGQADDTAALQRAIDEHEIVFLPKGYYRISRTLKLRAETKLVGISGAFSVIMTRADEGDFADPKNPRPMVQTADSAEAHTVVAFVDIMSALRVHGVWGLHWRAGADSICRTIVLGCHPLNGYGKPPPPGVVWAEYDWPWVVIDGHGGGRWYQPIVDVQTSRPGYRKFMVDGTRQPLAFYQLPSQEYAQSDAVTELRNARDISIFGVKAEGNSPIIWINHCDQVRIFGHGGNASPIPGRGPDHTLYLVTDSTNVLLANLWDTPRAAQPLDLGRFTLFPPDDWHMLCDVPADGAATCLPPLDRPTLYLLGDPKAE